MKRRKRTLNFRLALYMILTVVLLAIFLGYYYFNMHRTLERELYTTLERGNVYVNTRIDEVFSQVLEVAKTTGYTTALQKGIFSNDPSEKIANIVTARELLASAKDSNPYIVDLFYYSDMGHLYTISEYANSFRDNMRLYSFDKKIDLSETFFSDSPLYDHGVTFFFIYTPIYRTASGIAHKTSERAICALLFDLSPIVPACADVLEDDASVFILYDGKVISSNGDASVDESILAACDENTKEIEAGKEKYCVYTSFHDNLNLKVVSVAPKSLASVSLIKLDRTFYLLVALSVLIFAVLLFLFNREYTKKTNRMVKELKKMKLDSKVMRISVPKMSELSDIAEEINSMLSRLDEAAKREQEVKNSLLSATLAQKEAEMTAYRSQINPHFFFNTLECVRSMAQYYNADMIEDIISAMSKMFRYSLYSDMTVDLSSEVDMLEQYFLITCYRFPDKYVLKREIDENTLNYRVPSMILQPLVENCIKHAFVKNRKGIDNVITVRTSYTDEGLLKVVVKDNGCGMNAEALNNLKNIQVTGETVENVRKDSIGIHNIYERIKLFDSRNEMEFYSEEGEFTKVELILYPATLRK